ncbi:MAG: hypothetical protein V7637_5926 [Mycobacteriales bacterium]|jgi:hypothetical protein
MSEQGTAVRAGQLSGAPGGGRRPGSLRSATLAAAVAVASLLTLSGADAGSGRALADAGLPGSALGGVGATCGGVRLNPADLPGPAIGAEQRSGPAEGISQLLRLYEWTRHTPYDGARWSTVTGAGYGTALLVATLPGQAAQYIPVHLRSDGHWQIDTPCELRSH